MLSFYFDNKSNQICQTLEPTVLVGAASGGQFAGKPHLNMQMKGPPRKAEIHKPARFAAPIVWRFGGALKERKQIKFRPIWLQRSYIVIAHTSGRRTNWIGRRRSGPSDAPAAELCAARWVAQANGAPQIHLLCGLPGRAGGLERIR